MISLLLVSSNNGIVDSISAFAREQAMRLRVVATFDAARDWLSMNTFHALIVDRDVDPLHTDDLLKVGWQYAPMMVGAVISLAEQQEDTWIATLIGAKVFLGPHALERLRSFLLSIPRSITLTPERYVAVLLVEDLDAPRDIIATYIEALGFSPVVAVASAEEAIAALREDPQKFFCVVADIRMPKVTGIALTQKIRNDPELGFLPVIMLTSEPTSEHLVEAIRAGATGFLAKPPKKTALLQEIEKARRIVALHHSPRLANPEDAAGLEKALARLESGHSRSHGADPLTPHAHQKDGPESGSASSEPASARRSGMEGGGTQPPRPSTKESEE